MSASDLRRNPPDVMDFEIGAHGHRLKSISLAAASVVGPAIIGPSTPRAWLTPTPWVIDPVVASDVPLHRWPPIRRYTVSARQVPIMTVG